MLLEHDSAWRIPAAGVAGLLVGTISSLLGVAGGEFIIPILVFIFGANIKTAGTASVLISIPVVLTGVVRHWLTGHYRSQSMLVYLVLPMCIGSLTGAMIGGYLADWAPTDALRLVLAAILAISAIKLWSKGTQPRTISSLGASSEASRVGAPCPGRCHRGGGRPERDGPKPA